jgi:hypothetical protein
VLKNALACLFALAVLPCSAALLVSGDYQGLLIGVDRHGNLTGFFDSSTGRGKFSCTFFVSGKLKGASARVDTWFPENRDRKMVIPGVLEGSSDDEAPEIRLKLEEDHGGCWNVQRFAPDPATFPLTEKGSWQAIGVVASPKAYFYDSPASPKPRKAFAVTGNALRIFETRGGWVRAEYVSPESRRTRGWVQKSELFSPRSPASARVPGSASNADSASTQPGAVFVSVSAFTARRRQVEHGDSS